MWTPPVLDFNMPLADRVVIVAKSLVGQRELTGNSGFMDQGLQHYMEMMGWHKGESWCVYTDELIWKIAFGEKHPLRPLLDNLFSGSATATAANFMHSDKFICGDIPKKGALMLFRHGTGWKGHAALVEEPRSLFECRTVEGNSNSDGSREGFEVAERIREARKTTHPNKLNFITFVYLPAE